MIRLEPRAQPSQLYALLSPVLAIALTVFFGAFVMMAAGQEPIPALQMYFLSPITDPYNRTELLVKATPLILIGAGLAICFRSSVWNIGAAGQYTLGAIFAGYVGLNAPETGFWVLPIYLVMGALGGLLWAAIPALLKVRFNANEILTSLMLSYVAALLLDYLVRGPWRDPQGFGFPETAEIADSARMILFADFMPEAFRGTRVHIGIILAVIAAVALSIMLTRTRRGFSVRVLGVAPRAGAFAGFSEARNVWFVLMLSGALAGLAGAIEVSSTIRQLQPDISASYGFTAIIVAFLGRLNPIGAIFAGLVLAVSYIGGENAQLFLKLPKNVTGLFQGMLLFFLLATDILIRFRVRFVTRAEA